MGGRFLIVLLMISLMIGYAPKNVNAAVKFYSLNNDITLVSDTSHNKVLKKGDSFEVVISVSDYGIDYPMKAYVYQYYIPFQGVESDLYKLEATSFTHDDVNHRYIVTMNHTIEEDFDGIWSIFGVEFESDGIFYDTDFKLNESSSYQHFVLNQDNEEHIVFNRYDYRFEVGEKMQLQAILIPALEEKEVEWYSEDNSIVSVDKTGMVTANALGNTTVVAKYNGNEYKFYAHVWEKDEIGNENLQLLNNRATIESTSISDGKVEKGAPFKIGFSILDTDIDHATSAYVNVMLKGSDQQLTQYYKLDVKDFLYDSAYGCYYGTIEGQFDQTGEYTILNYVLKNDRNQSYQITYYENKYKFTVVDSLESSDEPQKEETTTSGVEEQTGETSEQIVTPQTGDSRIPVVIAAVLLVVSACAGVTTVVVQKKKNLNK